MTNQTGTGQYVGGTNYIEEVAAYIRVSTQEQKLHGISLEAQVEKLTEYAENHGMKIVKFYKDEGVSGRKLIKKRPALQEMIQDAEKGKFKRIIFIKVGVASETISRHAVTYFDLTGENAVMGFPKALMGFLTPYIKARFGQGVTMA